MKQGKLILSLNKIPAYECIIYEGQGGWKKKQREERRRLREILLTLTTTPNRGAKIYLHEKFGSVLLI